MNEQNTNMLERRLGDRLEALAASEAPAATVTVARVIESGHRERRRRRRSALGTATVLAAVAAVTCGMLTGSGNGGAAAGGASLGTAADPAAPPIAFGYLPASLSGEYTALQSAPRPLDAGFVPGTTAASAGQDPGGTTLAVWGAGNVSLSVFAATPGSTGSGTAGPGAHAVPAGSIRGHQAWWRAGFAPSTGEAGPNGTLEVMWEYEPDAWMSVSYQGKTGPSEASMVLKVAAGLVIGAPKPMALPFHLASVPSGLHPESVDVDLPQQHGAQFGVAQLRLCATATCGGSFGGLLVSQAPVSWRNRIDLSVAAGSDPLQSQAIFGSSAGGVVNGPDSTEGTGSAAQLPESGSPVTIDGHPATVQTVVGGGATLTFDYDGTTVTIEAAAAEYRTLGGLTGFLAFCRSLTWFGANPADWTTNVIG